MTRHAIYYATPNHIVEQPAMEKPLKPIYRRQMEPYYREMEEYNRHVFSLRTIPAHESARSLWKDGQKLTEGVDYTVQLSCSGEFEICAKQFKCDKCTLIAIQKNVQPKPSPIAHIGAGEAMEKQETLCRDAAHILTETNNPNLSKKDSAYWNRWREYFTALWKLIEQGYIITKR